jgi:GNAT superfamily N-acetyltransferase
MTSATSTTALDDKVMRSSYETILTLASAFWASWLFKWSAPNAPKNAITSRIASAISLVPIRSLGANHRERISRHLMSLNPRDRYLRFGYYANDHQIGKYVADLDFDRDEILGIYDRSLLLIAVAHLAYAIGDISDIGAEFGVSVLSHARGRGFGAQLFEHAARSARNRNITQIGMHALSENAPMIRIATDAGARVERHGSESEAYLQLTKPSIKSRLAEFVGERLALVDFRIKLKVQRRPRSSVKPEMPRH